MKDIKDILSNYQEQPTGRCWESIEQQLSTMFPDHSGDANGGASGSSSSGAGNVAQQAATFGSKAIAITAGSVAVTAITTIVIINIVNDDAAQITQNIETPTVVVDSVNQEDAAIAKDTVLLTDALVENLNQQENSNQNHPISLNSENNIPENNPPTANPSNTFGSTPTTSTVNTPVVSEKPAVAEQPKEKPVPTPKPAPISVIDQDDPAINNMKEPLDMPESIVIKIPNIFTPNGDGYNDYFEIVGIEHCQNNRLMIQDSDGKMIFSVKDYQNNWGQDAKDGVYFYFFTYQLRGVEQSSKGRVVVKR